MSKPPKIKVTCLQQQVGERDCGVFAVAFATSLSFAGKRKVQKFSLKNEASLG